jgi:threonine synthase
MQFRSTKSKQPLVSYKDAALRCLPEDGGLYVPDQVPDIRRFFLHMDEKTQFNELAAAITPSLLEGDLNPIAALKIAESAFNFAPELISLDENFSLLNLYNGPTGVFKDFGIAFLSAALEEFLKNDGQAMILSSAKSDSGASMAQAFKGRKDICLVLLYPSGQIYGLDSAFFIQNGGNIIPIQVKGTSDDCQQLVIDTINDRMFSSRYRVTSANTINAGRLLPQIFYYLYAFIQIKNRLSSDLFFSVPSGNFGNLIAGLYAWKFGMPVNGFIAAMNANNAFGDFICGKAFVPKPLIATNSPALDVSIPSNYERLASFYDEAPAVMRSMVYPVSVTDTLTVQTMENVREKYGIQIDANTAVAFAAAENMVRERRLKGSAHTVVLATGHPAPETFHALRKKCDPTVVIPPELYALESAVASCF